MRRPSLVVQQKDDDLSRLASSPVDHIAFSTASTHQHHVGGDSSTGSSSSSSSSSNSNSVSGTSGVGGPGIPTEERPRVGEQSVALTFLPKTVELEWQQQNHRKRKERLDSTSSNSQTDRKVGRPSDEGQSPRDNGVDAKEQLIRAEQQPLLLLDDKLPLPPSHASPLKSHHPHLLQHNLSSVSHHQYQIHHHKRTSGGNGASTSNNGVASGAMLSHLAWNNNVAGDDHYSDGEHERRRSSERFCRSRAPHGRKSSSCSAAKKSSSSSSAGGGGGVRFLSKAVALKHADEGGYKYDASGLKTERRSFSGRDSQKHKKRVAEERNVDASAPYPQIDVAEAHIEAPLPWNEFLDESPVVCPRFAENTFDHVINVSDKFIKINPPPKKETNPSKYVNNENMKTRDIMKKYGAAGQPGNTTGNNNNLSSWGKNRNGNDLRLMIITPDERMRQIGGRLTKLKKRILLYEEGFERDYGHRPDKADTLNDKAIKTIMAEIQRLKRERQAIRTCGGSGAGGLITPLGGGAAAVGSMFGGPKEMVQDPQQLSGDMKMSKMQETLTDIEMVLQERRKEDNRLEALDNQSMEQLLQEKTAVQKGLLYLEGMFGRPYSKEERDLARPLYDRYRQIKRLLNRNSSMISAPMDLPTILENEAMVFTSSNNTPSTDATPPESQAVSVDAAGDPGGATLPDESSLLNDNLHQLSIAELWHQLDIVREEKKLLRRTIKEFEQRFEAEAGRKMLKGDRKAMEETYALYKQKKGRLRLLDALVKKHMAY